jgi:hypothetical protein
MYLIWKTSNQIFVIDIEKNNYQVFTKGAPNGPSSSTGSLEMSKTSDSRRSNIIVNPQKLRIDKDPNGIPMIQHYKDPCESFENIFSHFEKHPTMEHDIITSIKSNELFTVVDAPNDYVECVFYYLNAVFASCSVTRSGLWDLWKTKCSIDHFEKRHWLFKCSGHFENYGKGRRMQYFFATRNDAIFFVFVQDTSSLAASCLVSGSCNLSSRIRLVDDPISRFCDKNNFPLFKQGFHSHEQITSCKKLIINLKLSIETYFKCLNFAGSQIFPNYPDFIPKVYFKGE